MNSVNTAPRARTADPWGPAPVPAPSTTRFPDASPAVIAPHIEMTGSISTLDELHIYGTVEGNVRAGSLVICKGGKVKGEIVAEIVKIHGSVEGTIQGMKVQLLAGAAVRGDIVHGALEIDPSAMFEGRSKRLPQPVALNAAAAF